MFFQEVIEYLASHTNEKKKKIYPKDFSFFNIQFK